MAFSPTVLMENDRYARELDRAARAAVEGRQIKASSRIVIRADTFYINGAPVAQQPARKPLVIIESPYGGDVVRNTEYARACLLDCLRRGEAPIASHLLHTQALDDMQPDERKLGIEAGLAWYRVAEKCVVYTDRGISRGMQIGIERSLRHGVPVEWRSIEERAAA